MGFALGLDVTFGGKQLGQRSISNGAAATTFLLSEGSSDLGAGSITVTRSDGIVILDDGIRRGSEQGPTRAVTTSVDGSAGDRFPIRYLAPGSNPSVLHVDADVAPVSLPAAVPRPAAGLAALGLMRLRRQAA
jgi:hypothetical protein